MAIVRKTTKAEQDLIEIYQYIAIDAPTRARNFLENLYQKFDLLSDNPFIGSARFPAYPDVRGFVVGSYVILYQPLPSDDGIEVIRVFHGMQDWPNLMTDELN